MQRVQGEKAGEYFPDLAAPPPEHRRAIGTQLATALAHLHAVPLDAVVGTGLDVGASVSKESLSAAVNGMAARISDLTGPPIAAVPQRASGCSSISTRSCHRDRCACCRVTSDCTTRLSMATWSPRSSTGRWPPGPPARGWQLPGRPPPHSWTGPTLSPPTARRRVDGSDGRAVGDVLPGLLRPRGLHVEPDRRPPVPHRRQANLPTAHSGLDAHFRAQRNLVRALDDAGAPTAGS